MLSFLQMADEFGFSVRSFHHAVEAYKIRDILAERGVAVSTWSDWWGFKMEAFDAVLPQIAMLASAQVRAVVHSDSAVGIQRLNQEAGKAWYDGQEAGFGVSEDAALRWITAEPAWVLGIDDQTGTLTPGKRADVVVWSHHPFSMYAKAERVFIDGAQVFAAGDGEVWSDFLRGQGLAAGEVSP
jgi:imidazolonepropionase-like amidohydrolase